MTVKTATETVEVQQTTYVAEDGQEFKTEAQCRQHEEDLRVDRLTDAFNCLRIDQQYSMWVPALFARYKGDDDWYFVQTRSKMDTDVLHEMFGADYRVGMKYLVIVQNLYDPTTWEFADVRSLRSLIHQFNEVIDVYADILAL